MKRSLALTLPAWPSLGGALTLLVIELSFAAGLAASGAFSPALLRALQVFLRF